MPAYLAARLALLALRASIGRGTPVEPDRVLLAPAAAAVSVDSAANALAALTKPVICGAQARKRVLVVTCRLLEKADAGEREWFHVTRRDDAERGGYMGYLIDQYGQADHLIAAFGRDESLVLPLSAVDLWHRDYEIEHVNVGGDDVGNSFAADKPTYQEAQRRGARGILQFSSPDDSQGHIEGHAFSLDDSLPPEERERTTQALIEMARMSREMLLHLDSLPPADSARPAGPWRRWQEKSLRETRAGWKVMAAEMEQFFRGRPMPREVAAFIEECRKRC